MFMDKWLNVNGYSDPFGSSSSPSEFYFFVLGLLGLDSWFVELESISYITFFIEKPLCNEINPSNPHKMSRDKGGRHSTVVAFALHNPAAPGSNLGISKNYS